MSIRLIYNNVQYNTQVVAVSSDLTCHLEAKLPSCELQLQEWCVLCTCSAGGSCGLCSVHVQHWRFWCPVFCARAALAVLVACVLQFLTYRVTSFFLSSHSTVCCVVALLFVVLVFADRTTRVQQSFTVNKTTHSRRSQFARTRKIKQKLVEKITYVLHCTVMFVTLGSIQTFEHSVISDVTTWIKHVIFVTSAIPNNSRNSKLMCSYSIIYFVMQIKSNV